MKKYLPQISMGVVLLIVIAVAVLWTRQPQQTATESTQKKTKKQLDQLTLPQLSNTIAKNESLVLIKTSSGNIKIKLFNHYAPLAVENFLTHAKQGYYNNTTFHRVIKDFMIQGGDPKGDGSGGESIWKNKNSKIDSGNGFKNEISTSLYNIRGALSMANAGTDTNGSQFFIVQNGDDQSSKLDTNNYPKKIIDAYKHGGYPSLDGQYTVFGQVISGMDIVDKIANAETKNNQQKEQSQPINPVKVTNIDILQEAK